MHRSIRLFWIFLFLLPFAPVRLSAQTVTKQLGDYYQAMAQDREMNGNVLLAENGKPVYRQFFGFSDVTTQKPITKNSQFELASVSKLFTAVAVLQLKEKGLVGLDMPFGRYFPAFPYPTITVRQLLAHTSGLPDIEELVDSLLKTDPQKQFTIHDDLQNILLYSRNHALKFQPGEKWGYSSAGYHLLGLLVEKLSGKSLATYIREQIFIPAGMDHSYIQTSMAEKKQGERTQNYQYNNHFEMKLQWMDSLRDWREWTYNLALETGGSGIISTADDLLRFDVALSAGKLLTPATQQEAYTPFQLNNGQPAQPFDLTYCGLGWFIFRDTSKGRIVWGSGANPGTISFYMRNLDNHQCFIVLHNIKCNPFNDLKAMEILGGKPMTYRLSLAFLYAQDLFAKGPEAAQQHYDALRNDSAHYELREAELDRAALEFRRTGRDKEAANVDELHHRAFPK